jgi:hypothetical protein
MNSEGCYGPSIEPVPRRPYLAAMQRWLITLGIVLLVAGLLWPLLQKIGLGRLPGDIVVERENFRLCPSEHRS